MRIGIWGRHNSCIATCDGVFLGQERWKQQQWQVVHKHNETSQKIAARAFAQRYLADLLPSVFDSLRDGGYFYDPIERGLLEVFC